MSRVYKKTKLALTLSLLLSVPVTAVANTSIVHEANKNTFEMQQTSINTGVALIENVRAALLSSYVNNNGWAPNTASLVATGYIGNVQAGWGQSVTGAEVGGGNSYALNLTAPNEYVAQGIASRLGGVAAGNVVAVTVPVPANASITESSLSRFAVPGDATRNRMETDIDMNSFNLQNVQVINGQSSNFDTGTFTTLNSTGASQFDGVATFGSSINVADSVTAKRIVTDEFSATDISGDNATFNGLTVQGGAVIDGLVQVGSLQSSSAINGVEVNATKSVSTPLLSATTVDATEVLADSAVIRGGIAAESGTFNELGVSTLTTSSANVNGPLTVHGLSEFVGDAVFRNNVLIHGGLEVISVATVGEIKEGGQFLKDRYLGIDATAKNADKLGNVEASKYARKDQANTWSQTQTFSGRVNANGEIYANGKRVVDSAGKLYYQGEDIDKRYLGINDKAQDAYKADYATKAGTADYATNAGKLGNVAASSFARRDTANTFTQTQTLSGRLNANKEVYANGKRVVGTDGTLYYKGENLDSRYLGKTAKAVSASTADNATKLNGLAASSYAVKNAVNVWDANQTFNRNINVLSTASLNALTVSGSATFNGAASFNNTVNMKKGVSVSGGNVQVASANDVKVGSISMKQMYQDIQDLKNASGGGGGGSWTTVYQGAGTNSINISSTYLQARVSYSYEYRGTHGNTYDTSWVPVTVTDNISSYNDYIGACETFTQTRYGYGGATVSASVDVCTRAQGKIGTNSWSATAYNQSSHTSAGASATAYGDIRNFKITKYEVFR